MIISADSGRQICGFQNDQSGSEDEFRLCRGSFVGTVQASKRKFEFSVRDMRREQPTIHGVGIDFSHAVTAVTQILDALTTEPCEV